MKSRKVNKFAIAAAVLALAGCGGAPIKKDAATIVQERAVARWNLLIAHKAEQAYDYLSPGSRTMQTREQYAASRNKAALHWQSVKPVDAKCDEDACTLHLMISYNVVMPAAQGREVAGESPVTERWIKNEGTWYLLEDTELGKTRDVK